MEKYGAKLAKINEVGNRLSKRNACCGCYIVIYVTYKYTSVMKEIALVGTNNKVFADVLSVLMARDVAVNAMVDFPEHVMVEDESLTVSRMDFYDEEAMREAFASYGSLVLTYDDNLLDVAHNNLALKTFADTLTAARKAGVGRVIVVAGQDSEAYFVSLLNRIDDIDWVFVSTEGDFPNRAADELIEPSFHREVYKE